MELVVFLVAVFLGLGYLARRQVLPRTQRERDRNEQDRPIGYGASVAPAGTSRAASVQAPYFASKKTDDARRDHGAE